MIGQQVNIEYADQNQDFGALLPRSGIIVRQLKSEDGADDWFQVKLEEPFDYQLSLPLEYPVQILHCSSLLIRSRLQSHHIGERSRIDIFIMLIPDERLLNEEPIRIEGFHHVAWGLCTVLQRGACPSSKLHPWQHEVMDPLRSSLFHPV